MESSIIFLALIPVYLLRTRLGSGISKIMKGVGIWFICSVIGISAISDKNKSQKTESLRVKEQEKVVDRTHLSKLKVERDEMREVSFYSHPKDKTNTNSKIRLYISETKGQLGLRFVIEYWSDSWLFVRKAWTKIDGVSVDLPTENKWTRENSSQFIWETSDTSLDKGGLFVIKKFANAKEPTIRFEGDKYYKDFKPSKEQLAMIREMISAYEAASGEEIK
jgi:hypothetical protein